MHIFHDWEYDMKIGRRTEYRRCRECHKRQVRVVCITPHGPYVDRWVDITEFPEESLFHEETLEEHDAHCEFCQGMGYGKMVK
jgi:hypothetical protein